MAEPVIAPLLEVKLSPLGSAGEIAYDNAPNPPVAVTGLNGVNEMFSVKVVVGIANVVTIGIPVIVKPYVLLLVCGVPLESETVIVYELVEIPDVVPVIAPVLEFMLKPVPLNDGEILNVYGAVPPVAVTGVIFTDVD